MLKIKVEELKELLGVQQEFDSRIATLNLKDSRKASVVEFFEWYNTLESFKNWKAKPGKPLDVQLDELADLMAFGLSIMHQENDVDWLNIEKRLEELSNYLSQEGVYENVKNRVYDLVDVDKITGILDGYTPGYEIVLYVLSVGEVFYGLDNVLGAYLKKMRHNHARQDGTVDKEKGYV